MLNYDYAMALKMYVDLNVLWPIYSGKSDEDRASMKDQFPIIADKEIRDGDYPPQITELLRAININYWLNDLGVSPSVDTLFSKFTKDYTASDYYQSLERQYDKWEPLSSGAPAPYFTGKAPDGKSLSLSDLKGKVVYIDVWATWCRPCIDEFPISSALQKQFTGNDEVVFLYVSVDKNEKKWKTFLDSDTMLNGTHLIDQPEASGESHSIWDAYIIKSIPRYILIDQAGKIVNVNAPRPSSGKVKDEIEKLLRKETTIL